MSAIRPTADEGSMKLSQSGFADADKCLYPAWRQALLGGIEHTMPSHEKVPEAGLSPADRNSRDQAKSTRQAPAPHQMITPGRWTVV